MSEPLRSPRPTFQPRVTLSLLYLAVFFFLYTGILVAPELRRVAREVPPGPGQQQAAFEAVRSAARPRLPVALVAAIATTTLAARAGALPGLRRRP
jgi:hypothetical protein